MFGFGRKAAIEKRARQLGETLHHLVSCVGSQGFDEFVEAVGRKDFKESYVDRGEGIRLGNRAYGFFEAGPHEGEFSFHATYHQHSRPQLIVEGHEQYFGLVITGGQVAEGIYVDLKDTVVATGRLGRDAKAMQAELLKFPGFESMQSLLGQFGR